jgi:hypothetical protein
MKRQKILDILKKIPTSGLSSDDAYFRTLTGGWTTKKLLTWWSNHPIGTQGANFTTCNAFVGAVAVMAGAKQGSWLAKGPLSLYFCNKDIPNSWVPASSGRAPRPGDFYSMPYIDGKGNKQEFGHVGIIYDVHDYIFIDTIDSGQGGRSANRDYIRWRKNRIWTGGKINGWVDIDIYFP